MSLLDRADRANVPMAAITNAPRLNAEMMLSGLGIAHRFKALVIGDELSHGKPHPLPYLEGLRAPAARPVHRWHSRIHGPGFSRRPPPDATIGIRTSLTHDDLIAAGAMMTAESFEARELIEMMAVKMGGDVRVGRSRSRRGRHHPISSRAMTAFRQTAGPLIHVLLEPALFS